MNWRPAHCQGWLRSRWLIGLGAAFLGYTLAGFFLVPALLKWQMLQRLPGLTKRAVAIRQVKLNPYALSLTIRGLALTEKDGTPFASFEELYVNLQMMSVIKRGLVFAEISLRNPAAHIVRERGGRFNFANLISSESATPAAKPPPNRPLPLIMIGRLAIAGGVITFTDLDRPTPFHNRLGPINVRLTRFTTRPEAGSPYSIVASSETGATFAWAGDLTIVPLRSAGTFRLTALPLPTYAPYLEDLVRIDLRDGRLDVQANYQLDAAKEPLDLEVSQASLQLHDLQLNSLVTSNSIVAIPQLAIGGVSASLARQSVRISAISSTGGVLQVQLNSDGTIEPLSLIKTPPAKAGAGPGGTGKMPVPLTDQTSAQSAWKLDLGSFQLNDYRCQVTDRRGAKPAVLAVDRLGLAVSGVALDTRSNLLAIAEVKLSGLTTTVTILPSAGSNTVAVAPAPVAAPPPAAPAPPGDGFLVKVAALVFTNATFRFTDQSLAPAVTAALTDFAGSVQGLSSALNTTAAVDLRGKVDNSAALAVSGRINPLASDLFVDLGIRLKDTRLRPTSPYTAKYVGYPLENGALSLDLHYLVSQRALKAQNKVRVDQLRLGPASNSPDAVKLPVKLAIALLQDRHGVIALDVPVTGRLDDPKFKLGPLLLQVFLNVITKAVTKPFAMLGAMFGGGEDLSFIACEPGRADFAAGESLKLETLAKALYERPALNVTVSGSLDPVKDRAALAQRKLEQRLEALRAQELTAASQKPPAPGTIKLEPADRERLVKLAYAEATGLVAARPSAAREATVLAHLLTKQNFGPLHPAATAAKNAAAKPAGQLTLADMEAKLLEINAPTPAELQALMQERATKVRDYLVQTGQVAADRLSLAAPKPVAAASEGQSRVNLALQ